MNKNIIRIITGDAGYTSGLSLEQSLKQNIVLLHSIYLLSFCPFIMGNKSKYVRPKGLAKNKFKNKIKSRRERDKENAAQLLISLLNYLCILS